MIQVNKANFAQEITNFKGVVLADFYADWCGPCKMLGPILHKMSDDNKDQSVKFVKIDVDAEQELAQEYNVMSIPTVVIFKDGKGVSQQVGVSDKSAYEAAIARAK